MNFIKAFSETIGKEAASPAGNMNQSQSEGQVNQSTASQNFTSDDMKAYVDAKFEALKTDLMTEMQNLNKRVETPQESDNNSQNGTNNSNNIGKKEESNNASNPDLSSSQHDSQ